MKQALFVFIIFTQFFTAFAQEKGSGRINGKVMDAGGAPVEYATITVYIKGNDKVLTGATTDAQGAFSVNELEEGTYKLVIESINYQSYQLDSVVLSRKNMDISAGQIKLSKKPALLQGVVVTSSKGLVENKIDKLVFNAEKDITSQVGVATDILKKVPQVSVDAEGNVQLAGNSSIRFLINGRPSAAFGSNVADVLQAIPASQIKSIEVVTNPGAKYDAQGMGGIINIILKQTKVKGINGNISLTGGSRNEGGSFNLNARRGNFGVNAFVSGNMRLPATTPSTYRRESNNKTENSETILLQDGLYRVRRRSYQTGIGFDWQASKHNSFNGSLSYNYFGSNGHGTNDQDQETLDLASGNIIEKILSGNVANNQYRYYNADASLGYKKTFNKDGQELEVSFNTSTGNNRVRLNNYQTLFPADSVYYGLANYNPATEKERELNINYTQPLAKDVVLGAGGKINVYDIASASDVSSFDPAVSKYLHNNSLSNSLDYKQKVYALYGELSFPVKNWFETKIGGRYERTEINSWYSNAQQQVKAPGYNTFVPSVFISKKTGEYNTFKISYSKRIERPGYDDLNPFVNVADPKNISAGNPYLLPEIGHRIEFSYTRNFKPQGSIMFTLFTRINEKDIQPYLVYYPSLVVGDSTYSNVTVSTRQNIGTEKNSGLNIFVDAPVTKKLNLRGNLSVFYRHTENALDPGYNSNSWNYRFNVNAAYQFSSTLAGEFFGNFNSARNELQGKYPSFTSYNMALRKQIWSKKGSIAIVATNPFGKYVNQRTQLYGPDFVVDSYRKIPFRAAGINFIWKFGKLEFKKDKQENVALPTGDGGNQ